MTVAIVGAGASGLFCAMLCAKAGADVSLFEQNTKPAKKILVSGNGRCNITNTTLSTHHYFSQNPNFVSYALEQFGFQSFEKFCKEIGLLLNVLEDGRAYPLSNEAKSVANIFEAQAIQLGVTLHTQTKIQTLQPLVEKYDAVVVATGSRAGEHLGGNDDGECFAREFGHTLIPAYPSLVQLHLDSSIAPKMSGTKIDAALTLLINAHKEQTIHGDILFTNYGVSGFAVLDISQSASEALLNFQAVDISINLLPTFNAQALAHHIVKSASQQTQMSIFHILIGLLPIKIVKALLEELSLSDTLTQIDTKLAKKIANKIHNWRFAVSDTHGFRHAEVSGGGVDTKELDPQTMMSKKQKNLYFTGEVLDVVGKRGGYNFAWAWASAYLAAQSILNKG